MKIIGIEQLDYTSKKTNKRVLGLKIYGEIPVSVGVGVKVRELYIPSSSPVYEQIFPFDDIVGCDVDFLATFDGKFVEMRIN